MRLNKYIAQATDLSRRAADTAIAEGRVTVNGLRPSSGQQVEKGDTVTLDGKTLTVSAETTTIMLNKPVGYVCSRDGQGSATIYDLLPNNLHHLNPVGRLDKDSSGLLLLTNDGNMAQQLTHPSYRKEKVYEVVVDKPLSTEDTAMMNKGLALHDGISHVKVTHKTKNTYLIRMSEGRNRQIRRTFSAISYEVMKLHRIQFGGYDLGNIAPGNYKITD